MRGHGLPPDLEIVLGAFPEEILGELSLVVISPGVPADLPIVEKIRQQGIPVWGEIELAYVFGKGQVLAITALTARPQRQLFWERL